MASPIILVVTGASGAGKTTLEDTLDLPIIDTTCLPPEAALDELVELINALKARG